MTGLRQSTMITMLASIVEKTGNMDAFHISDIIFHWEIIEDHLIELHDSLRCMRAAEFKL